ncbi:uncharacterized protein LAESUDRAFT_537492 [Laetiporus sulphureus 93-53]|uniref:Stealth protein CR3 conserved region 3 domain-containing protein n=1 Tax=Laetiporus sulphureus 93-53 TaxID=1314785 RepID=A0A165FK15_9APHY|nr:uncharacterized protein LAESUDRAFT_537492 [Laetiporus sulphureus 93-53]KZT09088.1 hypothetical protein LAESUDRAFT_537492 [Laetiporus sulphureus 93-53]
MRNYLLANNVNIYFHRKRALRIAAFTGVLLTLFLLLRRTLEDVDDIGLSELALSAQLIEFSQYLPFKAARLPLPSPPRTPLRPVRELPDPCLEAHFAHGELCHAEQIQPVDILWTWVNGSDVLLDEAKSSAQSHYSSNDPYRLTKATSQARMYRDHDELRYSMRSVLTNFKGHASRFRLLTSDFPMPDWVADKLEIHDPKSWRLGQMPQWLDLNKRTASNKWEESSVELSIVHHAEVFRPYVGTNFNSLAIESQFSNVDNLSEYFIYVNDDMFMMNELSTVSFYTSSYGLVIHMQPDLLVKPARVTDRTIGEWRSLSETNYLLSQRFGARYRPYVSHEPKTASRALLHEMAVMWPESFAKTATHTFRETERGDGDVYALFMHAHFVVERAREALLWAWVVARVGGVDGNWGEKEAAQAWAELGGVLDEKELAVQSGFRDTMVKERVAKVLKEGGFKPQSLTSYAFSSLDGYPYSDLGTRGQKHWPVFTPGMDEKRLPSCRISFDECFSPTAGNRASDIFKGIAFDKMQCGDCVIKALVRASGSQGVSAFLPLPKLVMPPVTAPAAGAPRIDDEPHLPLVHDWHDGDFSLRAVVGTTHEVNVRHWILQLMQRYRYVIGDTPSVFERLTSPGQVSSMLKRIERTSNVALLCLNDDVTKESWNDQVTDVLKTWFDSHWGQPAAWEQQY